MNYLNKFTLNEFKATLYDTCVNYLITDCKISPSDYIRPKDKTRILEKIENTVFNEFKILKPNPNMPAYEREVLIQIMVDRIFSIFYLTLHFRKGMVKIPNFSSVDVIKLKTKIKDLFIEWEVFR